MVGSVTPRSRGEARRAAAALESLVESMQQMAGNRSSILTGLLGRETVLAQWKHVPEHDACDSRSGYRWYYHAHPGDGRWPDEHGHFHLFADDAKNVTHLLAIAVDARGVPLGLVAPNQWVTDERFRPSSVVLRSVERFSLTLPRALRPVHRWLSQVLIAFAPQVRALLVRRDARLATLRLRLGSKVFDDRRVAVLSRCRIDLRLQAALLDRFLDIPLAQNRRSAP